jgi:F-type H+-transporting ATPase subunit gamma
MEMVAASKMRKAQERMRAARPYADKVRNIAAHMSEANPEYRHPFLIKRSGSKAGMIVVTTDKGLCGGLNTNILRAAGRQAQGTGSGSRQQGASHGHRQQGAGFMNRMGATLVSHVIGLGDTPHLEADRRRQGAARRYERVKWIRCIWHTPGSSTP